MWLSYGLLFALSVSVSLIFAKQVLKTLDEYTYLFLTGLFTLPILGLIILRLYQIPKIDSTFIFVLIISIGIDVLAAILAFRAIKISEVSLVGPISAFNPVFTAIISYIFLSEAISVKGQIGIILVCIGAYMLQLSPKLKNIQEPLEKLFQDKGVRLTLIASLLWAITPILQKTAISHTNPQVPPFVSFFGLIFATLLYGLFFLKFSRASFSEIKKFIPAFLALGLLLAVGQTLAFLTYSQTNLGFATSIFKTSIIFSVILGWIFFKEHNIKDRLAGSLVMLSGIILLSY